MTEHGTPEGYARGCTAHQKCPARTVHGLTCETAHIRDLTSERRYLLARGRGFGPAQIARALGIHPEMPTGVEVVDGIEETFQEEAAVSEPRTPVETPDAAQPLAESSNDRTPASVPADAPSESPAPVELDDAGRREEMGHPTIVTLDELVDGLSPSAATARKREIRAWAIAQGFDVKRTRPVPHAALAAYVTAHAGTDVDRFGTPVDEQEFSFTEQLDETRERIADRNSGALAGAVDSEVEGRPSNAGEFASVWNAASPDDREDLVRRMLAVGDEVSELRDRMEEVCEDRAAAGRQVELLSAALDAATSDLHALTGERDRARGTAVRLEQELARSHDEYADLRDRVAGIAVWWAERSQEFERRALVAEADARRPWWKRRTR